MITEKQYNSLLNFTLNCKICDSELKMERIFYNEMTTYAVKFQCIQHNLNKYFSFARSEYTSFYLYIDDILSELPKPYKEVFELKSLNNEQITLIKEILLNGKISCYCFVCKTIDNSNYINSFCYDGNLIENCNTKEQILNRIKTYQTFM